MSPPAPKFHPPRAGQIRTVTLLSVSVNLSLAALKLVAGVLGNSHALVADAIHSLSDLVTDFAVLIGVRYWSAPADKDHPYGHGRIETLVTAGIGLIVIGAGLGMAYHGLAGLQTPRTETIGVIALIAALVSMLAKEALFRWTLRVGVRVGSPAVIANAWHQRSDAISSLPAVVAVAAATVWPQLVILDSVGALVVSLFILYAGACIVAPALAQLVDRAAPAEVINQIASLAKGTPGVLSVSGIRTRYMGGSLQVDLCVQVDPDLTVLVGHEISEEVHRRLVDHGPDVIDAVVHLEPAGAQETGEYARSRGWRPRRGARSPCDGSQKDELAEGRARGA